MSDVMILSERNPYAKTVWLTTRNTHGENRFQVLLELDGKEEVLEDTWVPCLDSSEGVHLHSHQLSNLFNGRDEEISHLKALLKQAEPYLQQQEIEELKSLINYITPYVKENVGNEFMSNRLKDWIEKAEKIKL